MAYWGGPSARPQIWSGFWTQFWGPPAQCVSPGVSAKSQNRSAALPAPPRRSAPIELQTKAVWPNVRGVIFVARDTGIQGPYAATPPVRVLENLKNQRKNKRFSKEPRSTKLGRSRNLRFVFGAKTVFVMTCRALPEALFPSVSTSVSKRFEAFRGLSKPCFQGFEASRGLSRPVRGLGFCANHTVAQHIRGLRGLESI